jgi:hypothetical protein
VVTRFSIFLGESDNIIDVSRKSWIKEEVSIENGFNLGRRDNGETGRGSRVFLEIGS